MFITILNVLCLFQPFLLGVIVTETGTRIHTDMLTGWILQHCLSPSKTGNEMLIDREVVELYSKTILAYILNFLYNCFFNAIIYGNSTIGT